MSASARHPRPAVSMLPAASISTSRDALSYQPDLATVTPVLRLAPARQWRATLGTTATQGDIAMGYQALGSSGLTTAAVDNTAIGYQALNATTNTGYKPLSAIRRYVSNAGQRNTAGLCRRSVPTDGNYNAAYGTNHLLPTPLVTIMLLLVILRSSLILQRSKICGSGYGALANNTTSSLIILPRVSGPLSGQHRQR